jgi:hypothetical protein
LSASLPYVLRRLRYVPRKAMGLVAGLSVLAGVGGITVLNMIGLWRMTVTDELAGVAAADVARIDSSRIDGIATQCILARCGVLGIAGWLE